MVNRKRPAPVGQSRLSMSLGSADPRLGRNAEANLRTDQNLGKSIRLNRRGQLEVKPAGLVKDLEPDATVEDVVAKLNEILRGQRASGQMKGG